MVSILGANSVSGAYEVSNSLRLNDGDNAQLDKTFGSGGNLDKFTVSMWIKISTLASTPDSANYPFIAVNSSPGSNMGFRIRNTDLLQWYHYSAVDGDAGYKMDLRTNMLFRDPSAWYHIVGVYDSANGTEAHRGRMYVNGVEASLSGTPVYPSSGLDGIMGGQIPHSIGGYPTSGGQFDGYITEMHYVDGQALGPTSFGEFNDNGVWIPKRYSGSHGTVGFYLQFKQTGTSANSSGIGADTSGNDNHFTSVNLAAIDITEDTCTNNFATLNPLKTTSTSANLSEGNTKFSITANSAGSERNAFATITFPNSGKWYMETKVTHSALSSDSGNQAYVGVLENPDNIDHLTTSNPNSISTNGIFTDVSIVGTLSDRIQYGTNGSATSYNTDPDWSSGDIIGIALDMDNGKIYYHLNGTYYDDASGNVPNPATPANHNHSFTVPSNGLAFFVSVLRYNTSTIAIETNFGNPSFAISSGNNDGDYGNFEYAPPSGYYALCTKRLAEFG